MSENGNPKEPKTVGHPVKLSDHGMGDMLCIKISPQGKAVARLKVPIG